MNPEQLVIDVLKAWHNSEPGYYRGRNALIEQTGIPDTELRKLLPKMVREGKILKMPLFSERTGMMMGSGYFISNKFQKV